MKNFRKPDAHGIFLCALDFHLRGGAYLYFPFGERCACHEEIGLLDFTGAKREGNDIYGIPPMILGSLYITAGARLLSVC